MSGFSILRGQSVRWKLTLMSGDVPADTTGCTWGVAETTVKTPPSFQNGGSDAWLVWTAEQTEGMTTGRKKLRIKLTQANGDVKVFPDIFIAVQ